MKCLLLIMFPLMAVNYCFCRKFPIGGTSDSGVHFIQANSWAEVKRKAAAEHKYIFVDAFATWCGPCKQMDREVYVNDTIGAMMDQRFIAVKVQLDSSVNDGLEVKNWYRDAQNIKNKYGINAFPTLLFFDSEGKLVYRKIGYDGIPGFVASLNKALDPENEKYFSKLERYEDLHDKSVASDSLARYALSLGYDSIGRAIARDYIGMVGTAALETEENILFVRDVANNRKLADTLFENYRERYLNGVSDKEVFTESYLRFTATFNKLIRSSDRFFQVCYSEPDKVDSILKVKVARTLADSVIIREEIGSKVSGAGYFDEAEPDWSVFERTIQEKYGRRPAEMLVWDFQIRYYKGMKAWSRYSSTLVKRVNKYGPWGAISDEDFNLNNLAWYVFLHSDDTMELKSALSWSNRAMQLVRESKQQANLANWMDTNANLLYKLGRRMDAIQEERQAISLNPQNTAFKQNLGRMESGEQTW